ncbi:MAG: quinone-dependent dihydroorotate dehydrogenase [Nanoarchaeota archaeon]|nr:quinone-dependent dihydroorotate dehydrogenase [Nanoarchaeota archaeon]
MGASFVCLRNAIIGFAYKSLFRSIFFLIDPEVVHDGFLKLGKTLGSNFVVDWLFGYKNRKLKQKILGISFDNPIGLAAGFDKNGELTDVIPSVGFGFMEIGSITGEKCEGNPKPRLWRLKKLKSLKVYYGLNNHGCEIVYKKLKDKKFKIPLGISIAKTNIIQTNNIDVGIKDYIKSYKAMNNIGDYAVINISCPNTFGGEPFLKYKNLEKLLSEISKIPKKKPIFLKISPDMSIKNVDEILKTAIKYKIDGIICGNLTKKNTDKGGLSGKPTEKLSNRLIKHIYSKTKGKLIIIGCGGVDSAESAYTKIKLGASLIQLVTGMIYEGPQIISAINIGLVKLLEKDEFNNISEAVGSSNKLYSVKYKSHS